MTNNPAARVVAEFARVQLGDRRLEQRAEKVARRISHQPDAAFPDAMADSAELEALYRFANNAKVDLQSLLAPHVEATHSIMAKEREALVIHDTTECHFSGQDSTLDIGFIGKRPGFLVHTALAVSADSARAPLGVLGMMPIVRAKPQLTKRRNRSRNPNRRRESDRWGALIERTEKDLPLGTSLIHVMDREADIYKLLLALTKNARRFVIRSYHDRRVDSVSDGLLGDVLSKTPFHEAGERHVWLGARNNDGDPRALCRYPTRGERLAKLAVRSAYVSLSKPSYEHNAESSLSVSVVQVCEVGTAPGEQPVQWTLLTSEPVDTVEQAWRVVDLYRARWRIEEYFKALKTGCQFEKRQFESSDALLRILGLLAPIAWQLLAVRTLAREDGESSASSVLRPAQTAVLIALGRLHEGATTHEALLAIARLGGHLKRNGPPGWIVLGRGIEKLDAYALGWSAAKAEM